MRRLLTLFGLVVAAWWGLRAFQARGDSTWIYASPGLESRSFSWHGAHIFAFRTSASRIKIGHSDYLEAPEWLSHTHSHVATNGGYFDGRGRSMGLRVSKGQKVSNLRSADWGVFWIKDGKAHISHTRDYKKSARPDEAVQCGPRLVVAGKATDLKPQCARRTGLGIDGTGRVVLAIADDEMSLEDWAQVFAAKSGLNCRDALNLDGGPSTQMAYSAGTKHGSFSGGWPVPDAILIR